MINLEWYRSFIAVYRFGTMSRAAEVLYLTQPAISQHVAALEKTLGTTLFERSPRKMLPTEAGKLLYNQVAAAMETLESIPTRNVGGDNRQVIRLGTPQEFFSEIILSKLPQNNVTFYTIRFGLAEELIDRLQQGEIDMAIATQKLMRTDIEYQLLFEENFWLVAPPGINMSIFPEIWVSPLGGENARVTNSKDLTQLAQWLKTQPLIAYSEDLPIIRRFWRVVFGSRIDSNPNIIIPDLRLIRDAIALGLGFSVLPDYLCAEWVKNGRLTLVLKPEQLVTNQIWLAFRKSERHTEKIKFLLNIFRDTADLKLIK
ncbi:MAG: LysR family transcriptional regulator [Calothrix sp. CSU_2_0]|nr:LysR family transcriptional regulator [Calothrix sp. CSU_2_0]